MSTALQRQEPVAALAILAPLSSTSAVDTLALPGGVVRVGEEDLRLTAAFGPETSAREVSSWIVPSAVNALVDGFSTSVVLVGDAPERLALGDPTAPGVVFYAIDRIHDTCLARGGDAWQAGVSAYTVVDNSIVDLANGASSPSQDPLLPVSVTVTRDESTMAEAVNSAVAAHETLLRRRPTAHLVIRFALYDTTLRRGAFLNIVALAGGPHGSDTTHVLRVLQEAGQAGTPESDNLDAAAATSTPARVVLSQLRDARFVVVGCVSAQPGRREDTLTVLRPLAMATAAYSQCQRHPATSLANFTGGPCRYADSAVHAPPAAPTATGRRLNFGCGEGGDMTTLGSLAATDLTGRPPPTEAAVQPTSWPRPYHTPEGARIRARTDPAPAPATERNGPQATDAEDGDGNYGKLFELNSREREAASRAAQEGAAAATAARMQARHTLGGMERGLSAAPAPQATSGRVTFAPPPVATSASVAAEGARRRVQELLARHRQGSGAAPAAPSSTYYSRVVRTGSSSAGDAGEEGLCQDLRNVRRHVQAMDEGEAVHGRHYPQAEENGVRSDLHAVRVRLEERNRREAQADAYTTTSAAFSSDTVGQRAPVASGGSAAADAAVTAAKRTLHEEILHMTEAKRSAQLAAERAQQELRRVREQLGRAEQERDAKADLVAQQAQELDRLRRAQVEQVGTHATLKEQVVHREAQAERTTILNEELQAELARCRDELQAIRAENVGLARRADAAEAQAQTESTRADAAERRASEAESAVRARQSELREAVAGRIALEHEAERHRLRAVSLENDLDLATHSHDDLRRGAVATQATVEQEREQIVALQRALEVREGRLAKTEAERDAAQQALQGAQDHGARLQQQLDDYHTRLDAVNKRVEALKRQRSSFQRNFDVLMGVLVELHRCVDAAAAHAEKCQLRGYFAIKARKLHDEIRGAFDDLVDFAVAANSKLKGRSDVLDALKRQA